MTKALIIGGGIAGPAAAVALRKAGVDAAVYEAYAREANGTGAFLTLAVNGMDALATLGIAESVRGLGFATPAMEFRSGTGRRLGRIPLVAPTPEAMSRTVTRADLHEVLRDAAVASGATVEHDKRLVDIRTESGGVRAIFADGTEATGDLLVGADGVRSATRRLIDSAAPSPRYVPLGNLGGITRGVTVPGDVGVPQMMFGRECFFAWMNHPNGEVWWFANPPQPEELSREELAAIPAEERRRQLLDLLAADTSPAQEIIGATDHILAGWNTYDLPTVPTWRKGRVVLIGDAVHAMAPSSGQGASQAIEDAVVLAKCVRDHPTIEGAGAGFESARRQRVERVVALGQRSGSQKAVGPVGRMIRDATLPLVFRLLARSQSRSDHWLYSHHIEWESDLTLGGR